MKIGSYMGGLRYIFIGNVMVYMRLTLLGTGFWTVGPGLLVLCGETLGLWEFITFPGHTLCSCSWLKMWSFSFLLPPPCLPLAVVRHLHIPQEPEAQINFSCCWRWCFYRSSRKTNNTGVSVPDGQVLPEGSHTCNYSEILLRHSTRTSGCKGSDLGFLRAYDLHF